MLDWQFSGNFLRMFIRWRKQVWHEWPLKRPLSHQPRTRFMGVNEPAFDVVRGWITVLRDVALHHLRRGPGLALTREVQVLDVCEVFAHGHSKAETAVEP